MERKARMEGQVCAQDGNTRTTKVKAGTVRSELHCEPPGPHAAPPWPQLSLIAPLKTALVDSPATRPLLGGSPRPASGRLTLRGFPWERLASWTNRGRGWMALQWDDGHDGTGQDKTENGGMKNCRDQKQVGGPGLALAVDADTVTGVTYRLRVRNHCDSTINNMTTIQYQDSLSQHRCACDACTVLHNSCYVQPPYCTGI